jgi:GTP cyclohydrolase I
VDVDTDRLARLGREFLEAIGEDPDRDGLTGTPERWARMWGEFIDYQPGSINTSFEHRGGTDDLVAVSGIQVWSCCEHHLLPFSATIAIGYLPGKTILGLSKFGRVAHDAAHRLQVQERLVSQIADRIMDLTESPDVAVVAQGEHLCMTMRGIRTAATMTSSVMRGRFRDLSPLRAEFLALTRP